MHINKFCSADAWCYQHTSTIAVCLQHNTTHGKIHWCVAFRRHRLPRTLGVINILDVEICWLHSTVHRITRAQICTSLRRRFTDVLHFGVTVCRYKRSTKFAVTNILSEYCHKVWYNKPEWCGYQKVGKVWEYVYSFRHNRRTWQTLRRTDGRTPYDAWLARRQKNGSARYVTRCYVIAHVTKTVIHGRMPPPP